MTRSVRLTDHAREQLDAELADRATRLDWPELPALFDRYDLAPALEALARPGTWEQLDPADNEPEVRLLPQVAARTVVGFHLAVMVDRFHTRSTDPGDGLVVVAVAIWG